MSGPTLFLLPGRALLWHRGRKLEHSEGEGWEGALASLATLRSQVGNALVGARVQVSLSHHFASVHLLEPPPIRLALDEMAGWIQERLMQDYGPEADSWRVAWQDVPPGRRVPVTSMQETQYQQLIDALTAAGLAPRTLSPWFITAWQRHRRVLARAQGWLALLEPDRLLLLRLDHGHPMGAVLQRLPQGLSFASAVEAAITRQALQSGMDSEGTVYCLAPDVAMTDMAMINKAMTETPPTSKWHFHPLAPAGQGWEAVVS